MFFLIIRPFRQDQNMRQPRSLGRGVWEGRWLAVFGIAGGGSLLAGWLAGWLLGWLRVVVLKVGERLAGGTLARVYNASTGSYDAL